MKYWWRNVVKDYFTFSRKERRGLLVLFLILATVFILPRFITVKRSDINKDRFEQELARLKIVVDSSRGNSEYPHDDNYPNYSQPKPRELSSVSAGKPFDFDPNTLNPNGWRKLGVREKTINTIQKFLASGYKFRQPEDIKKIYGLSKEEAKKLIPHIHIAADNEAAKPSYAEKSKSTASITVAETKKHIVFDINTADTSDLISLPGIGSKLASRIVNFRQKLGGFVSVDQLGETYGLPDSTFQKIKARFQCINPAVKTIDINTADVNELRTHPYLRWTLANAIVNYRQQHGNYKSVEDIKKIDLITNEVFQKIFPYLTF